MCLFKSQSPSTDSECEVMNNVPYASAVGSVMYAMVCCRPDIAYSVSQVSKFMSRPGKQHWNALKWLLRYLAGTKHLGLLYGLSDDAEVDDKVADCSGYPLLGYVDSDHAGDKHTRRSTTGLCFSLLGGTVSWRSVLQPITALSSTEAEYIALTEAAKKGIWLKNLINCFGISQKCVLICCDSASALCLVSNHVYHARTKHIDIRYHKIRELVDAEELKLVKVLTKRNTANVLTNTLQRDRHAQHYIRWLDNRRLEGRYLEGLQQKMDIRKIIEDYGLNSKSTSTKSLLLIFV